MNELRAMDLDEVIYNHETEDQEFKVRDLQGANWCFRKLKALEERKAELNAVAEEELQRINNWRESAVKSIDNDEEYFKAKLMEYYAESKAEDKKFKLTTPYGKVTSRKSKKWCYQDEQAIMDFCNVNEIDVIRVKEELDKKKLKEICKDGVYSETGELVPGLEIIESEDITVKVE